jgi:hypothetical protein
VIHDAILSLFVVNGLGKEVVVVNLEKSTFVDHVLHIAT